MSTWVCFPLTARKGHLQCRLIHTRTHIHTLMSEAAVQGACRHQEQGNFYTVCGGAGDWTSYYTATLPTTPVSSPSITQQSPLHCCMSTQFSLATVHLANSFLHDDTHRLTLSRLVIIGYYEGLNRFAIVPHITLSELLPTTKAIYQAYDFI